MRAETQSLVAEIGIRTAHRRRYPKRGARLPILDALSLAKDVDTEEEALALDAAFRADDA